MLGQNSGKNTDLSMAVKMPKLQSVFCIPVIEKGGLQAAEIIVCFFSIAMLKLVINAYNMQFIHNITAKVNRVYLQFMIKSVR